MSIIAGISPTHLELFYDALKLLLGHGRQATACPLPVGHPEPRLVALVQVVRTGGVCNGGCVGQVVQFGGEGLVLGDPDVLVFWSMEGVGKLL